MMTVDNCLTREFRTLYRCLDCWRITADVGWVSDKEGFDVFQEKEV